MLLPVGQALDQPDMVALLLLSLRVWFLFERRDRLADPRLRDPQPLGRPGEAARLHHRREHPELRERDIRFSHVWHRMGLFD